MILIFILVLAFGLRIYGIYPGYPDIHPDEGASYGTAVHMLYNFLKPDRFDYPAGMPLINLLAYIIFFIPFLVSKIIFTNLDSFFQLIFSPHNFLIQEKVLIFGNRDFYAMYWSRAITALFGTGSVIVLYLAGKKLFNREVGLFAAFFLAVNYLHVVRSHFGLQDVYNGFFAMLTLYVSVLILEKNTRKRYLLAGVVAGIAFSLKYQVFSLIPFIVAHSILTIRKKNIRYFFHKNAFLAALAFIATFLIINPYYISNLEKALYMNKQDILRYGMGNIFLRPYGYFYLFHWGIDRLPSIMVVLGMIIMLFKKPFQFLLITPYVLVFMFFMTVYSQGGGFTRNFAQVIPFFMLFAGYGIFTMFTNLKKINGRVASILTALILLLINFSSIKNSLILDYSYAKPWNVHLLGEWLRDKLPARTTIRNYQWFIRETGANAVLDKEIVLKDWRYDLGPNSVAEFQEENTDFAILNTSTLQSITYWWRGWLDPKMYLKYNTVPFDFIENDFYGLTIREFLNYTVFEAYKPWQSHHDNNYLIFKIPKNPVELGRRIANFGFDSKGETWVIRGAFGHESLELEWDGNYGKNAKGALKIEPSLKQMVTKSGSKKRPAELAGERTSRMSSYAIPITGGKLYTVRAFVLNPKRESQEENDGFLRLDFYKDNNESTIKQIGINVAVSKRASASGEWESVQTSLKAPNDAKFMTISFQRKDLLSFPSFLDDVELFETETIPEAKFQEVPYIEPTIPLESIYYNTFI